MATPAGSRSTTPTRNRRYQRLPKVDTAVSNDDELRNKSPQRPLYSDNGPSPRSFSDPDDGLEEVTVGFSDYSTNLEAGKNVFRSQDSETSSNNLSSSEHRSPNVNSPHAGSISGTPSITQARSQDSVDLLEDWEGDVEDGDIMDEEDGALRRYHFNFDTHTDVPLPAEFGLAEPLPKRLWMAFTDLQAAARQRRASRLLTMPSPVTWQYQARSCLLTWCCDATDQGVSLIVLSLVLWLLIGVLGHLSGSWWLCGLLLFSVRVSARRVYEYFQSKRRKLRQRLSSVGDASNSSSDGDFAWPQVPMKEALRGGRRPVRTTELV